MNFNMQRQNFAEILYPVLRCWNGWILCRQPLYFRTAYSLWWSQTCWDYRWWTGPECRYRCPGIRSACRQRWCNGCLQMHCRLRGTPCGYTPSSDHCRCCKYTSTHTGINVNLKNKFSHHSFNFKFLSDQQLFQWKLNYRSSQRSHFSCLITCYMYIN